jgi:hypothetical protein
MDLTGLREAIAAARGRMTPEEQQMFAATAALGLLPGAKFAEPAAEAAAQATARGIRAWHASPYDFAKFDMSKIGTGQGAQSYGHGIYAAENPAVSGPLGRYDYEFTAKNLGKIDLNQAEAQTLRGLREGKSDLNILLDLGRNGATFDEANEILSRVRNAKAKIYETNINADQEHFLDWDKPLSEQSEHIKSASNPDFIAQNSNKTPQQAYPYGINAETAQQLRQAGIPGIKYLDQGSRDQKIQELELLISRRKAGEQGYYSQSELEKQLADAKASKRTYNYVVFDDKLIDIVKKYGMAGLIAANASNWTPKGKQ